MRISVATSSSHLVRVLPMKEPTRAGGVFGDAKSQFLTLVPSGFITFINSCILFQ
jgi:hypothetical protein